MTAEVLLLCLSLAAAALAASVCLLLLAAFGPAGWLVITAFAVTGALVWRMTAARLAATASWLRDDLRDDWKAN